MAVRLGRSEEYGHLTCGACTEATRDKMRCPLALTGKDTKGEVRRPPRPPAAVPTWKVDMGQDRRAALFTACPLGTVLTDEVTRWITTYGFIRRFNRWPAGREDPRFLEVVSILQREHDRIDDERIARERRTP